MDATASEGSHPIRLWKGCLLKPEGPCRLFKPFQVTSLGFSPLSVPEGPPTHLHWSPQSRLDEISRPGFCAPAQRVLVLCPGLQLPQGTDNSLYSLAPGCLVNAQCLILVGVSSSCSAPTSDLANISFFISETLSSFCKQLFNDVSDFIFKQAKQIQLPQLFYSINSSEATFPRF